MLTGCSYEPIFFPGPVCRAEIRCSKVPAYEKRVSPVNSYLTFSTKIPAKGLARFSYDNWNWTGKKTDPYEHLLKYPYNKRVYIVKQRIKNRNQSNIPHLNKAVSLFGLSMTEARTTNTYLFL